MVSNLSDLEKETYFLIAKYLEDGPCKEAANALRREIQTHQLLPRRTDWVGNTHPRTVAEMESQNSHVTNGHLTKLLARVGPLLENVIPTKIKNVKSLLTTGRLSLFRTSSEQPKPRNTRTEATCYHGCPMLPPVASQTSNFVQALSARSLSGTSCTRNLVTGCNIFSKVSMHKRILGHLASVYCVLFDKTGHVIATGADDNLVKLWSSFDGRLLATLRGHSGEISDLAINQENTLIAAGSCDKSVRVWSLTTTAPVAVLQGHTGMITSLEFCPSAHEDARYLMSTGGDGTVCFWKWDIKNNHFETTPIKFNEKSRNGAQMLCSSFSPGGGFLVTGSSDNITRIYQMMPAPVEKIAELSVHCDHVDSIQYSHGGFRFATGSRDGTARIWQFQRNEWKHVLLNAYQRLKKEGRLTISISKEIFIESSNPSVLDEESLKSLKLKVTMVGWNLNDQFLVTAITDHSLKVWDSFTGELVHILLGHSDEVFVLVCHPHEPYIYLSAGHDGNVILWDLLKGVMVKSFFNLLEGQGHGAIFDSRFAPNGMGFAVSDSHGHLCIFGFGSDVPFDKVPYEQFFHTDYRPLIRDANNFILDEQTQMAPHLMPPPFLVDVDGNPHSPTSQLLIPGRNINNLPTRRVEIPISNLPPLLAEIAAEEAAAAAGRQNLLSPDGERRRRNSHSPLRSPAGGGGGGVGLRQSGDVEGVRQVDSNVFISHDVSDADQKQWRNRKIVPQEKACFKKQNYLYRQEQGKAEVEKYVKEKKRRALSTSQRLMKMVSQEADQKNTKKKGKGGRAAPRARITYNVPSEMLQNNVEEEDEDELIDIEQFISSESDSDWNSGSSDSSEDSDWTKEVGLKEKVQEQREARRRRARKVFSSDDDDEDENETDNESEKVIVSSANEEEEDREKPVMNESEQKKETGKGKKKKPKKNEPKAPLVKDTEAFLEFFRPPDWITTMQPEKSPYVPQIGDEVYYFWQGHDLYVKAVLKNKLYDINAKKQCYVKHEMKPEELCRVTHLQYSVGKTRTCLLRLAMISPETGANTGGSFSVKFHDMDNVVDFFVLRQHYDQAVRRNWKPGDRFRCAIEDRWWSGTIIRKNPFQQEYPNSHFQALEVRWDTGETEQMSPWDMEPVSEDDPRAPIEDDEMLSVTSDIPVTDEDRSLFDYISLPADWPDEERDVAIRRITNGIEQFSELPVCGAFAYPVDVEAYPDYWSTVPYPTDLNTIRQRLLNRFYRRRNALLWEIKLIETNTRLYNEEKSEISQNSSAVTKVLLAFVTDPTKRDLIALYNEAMDNGGFETEEKAEENSSNRKRSVKKAKSSKKKKRQKDTSALEDSNGFAMPGSSSNEQSWTSVASDLLDFLLSREDSAPFRIPVDTDRYPDYTTIVREPMDLGTIRQQLDNRLYDDPEAVIRDVRLIFANSRLYNTNKRSKIYGMTLRLSALFEDRVQTLQNLSTKNRTRRRNSKYSKAVKSTVSNSTSSENWPNFSVSNRSSTSLESEDSSLRLVLRRSIVASEGESAATESSDVRRNAMSPHTEHYRCDNDFGSPRRTGIAINLRTGRARDLSDENNVQSDSDGDSLKFTERTRRKEHSVAKALKTKSKKRKRLNMPREFPCARASRYRLEYSGSTSADVVESGAKYASSSRDTPSVDESSKQGGSSYSTRSGRRVRPKRYDIWADSEKENIGKEENGYEKRSQSKRRLASDSSDKEKSDAEEVEDMVTQNGEDDESNYESEAERPSDEDTNSEEEQSEENTSGSGTDEISPKNTRSRTSQRNKSVKTPHRTRGKTSATVNSKKRRRDSDGIDSRSRKVRRTRLKVNYNEDIEDETSVNEEDEGFSDSDESTNIIGVSSRGRVRKAASRYADYVDS